jgi:hypothetical protein
MRETARQLYLFPPQGVPGAPLPKDVLEEAAQVIAELAAVVLEVDCKKSHHSKGESDE